MRAAQQRRTPAAAGRGRRVPRRPAADGAARRHRRHSTRRSHRRARRRLSIPVGDRAARTCHRRPRPADRRQGAAAGPRPGAAQTGGAQPAVARSDRGADRHRRAGDRRPADLRTRTAHRPVRRQRRRQEHAARHDGARHRGRCRRARARRRARPRSAQRSSSTISGREGLERAVVVVSTSDSPPLLRLRAAYGATAIAEHFRDEGKNVLLMMDSVTRFAMAQREVGLAAGEPPTAKGYPPSVFAMLPGLLERAGNLRHRGSITAIYSVLVEGDDTTSRSPTRCAAFSTATSCCRAIWPARNHYPAIDVLHSISRTMPDVTDVEHRRKAGQVREWMAALRDSEDLVSVGAYVHGSNPRIDGASSRGAMRLTRFCVSRPTPSAGPPTPVARSTSCRRCCHFVSARPAPSISGASRKTRRAARWRGRKRSNVRRRAARRGRRGRRRGRSRAPRGAAAGRRHRVADRAGTEVGLRSSESMSRRCRRIAKRRSWW